MYFLAWQPEIQTKNCCFGYKIVVKGMVFGKTTLQQIKNKTEQTSKLKSLLHRSFQAEEDHMHI